MTSVELKLSNIKLTTALISRVTTKLTSTSLGVWQPRYIRESMTSAISMKDMMYTPRFLKWNAIEL